MGVADCVPEVLTEEKNLRLHTEVKFYDGEEEDTLSLHGVLLFHYWDTAWPCVGEKMSGGAYMSRMDHLAGVLDVELSLGSYLVPISVS